MATLFKNATIVDVIGETVMEHTDVFVENGLIKEIGANLAAPAEADVVDLTGKTMLPGLFNCHVHMCSGAGTGARETLSDASLTVRAIKNLTTLVNSGVTYIRDAGAPHFIDVDLHEAQMKGDILAPEMQTACRCICMTGGHGHAEGREAVPVRIWSGRNRRGGRRNGGHAAQRRIPHAGKRRRRRRR